MKTFSIKQYLIDYKLVDKDGNLICLDNLALPSWSYGPCDRYETMIRLTTLVYLFEKENILNNMIFSLKDCGNGDYMIFIDQIEEDNYFDFDIDLIIETINFLVLHMAGSNVSYLGETLFWDN